VLPVENMLLARSRRGATAASPSASRRWHGPRTPLVARINAATGGFGWLFVALAALAAVVFAAALLLPGDRRAEPSLQPAE
jgi:hypothetical protein